jgi:hypothetical protein
MHGGAPGSGAPTGNRNALRHGRYGAHSIAMRQEMRALLRIGSVAETTIAITDPDWVDTAQREQLIQFANHRSRERELRAGG